MESRKLLLQGLMLGSLAGCAQSRVADKSGNPAQAGAVAAASNSSTQAARRPQPPEPTEVDAKPTSLVQLAEIQATLANDKTRPQTDRQNSFELAKANYLRAIKLDSKLLPAYLGMARLCSNAGEHEMAIHSLASALAISPRDASLWYERGMVMGRQKRYDDALQNLAQASQLDPNNPNYGKSLGLMLAHAGRTEESVAQLQRWMSEADAHYNVARILDHIGLTAESQRQLQLALKADPSHRASLAMYRAEATN